MNTVHGNRKYFTQEEYDEAYQARKQRERESGYHDREDVRIKKRISMKKYRLNKKLEKVEDKVERKKILEKIEEYNKLIYPHPGRQGEIFEFQYIQV